MAKELPDGLVGLAVDGSADEAVWQRVFTVSSLVLIGTREEDGEYDLAPKHMAMPLGRAGHFGFVCTPRHATLRNTEREGEFTVSYPRPSQIVLTSLAAAPRCGDDAEKPSLEAIPTFPAVEVDGVLLEDGYLFLECVTERVVGPFGEEDRLVVGRVVAAHVRRDALRSLDKDDQGVIRRRPLLAYLHPGRFSRIETSYSFPYHEGFEP